MASSSRSRPVPVTAEAFVDYRLEGVHLTRLEVESLRTGQPLATENKREQREWEEKRARMGLSQEAPAQA